MAGRLALMTLLLCACGEEDPAPRQPTLPDAGTGAEASWRLVWSDEFEGAAGTPPDPARWVHDVGGDGWGNDQLEFDTDRVENAAHDGQGNLVITAREEAFGGRAYTSARIKTQGLFAQRHGRFEARIRLPAGRGLWPAFWMLGDDIETVGWPRCGEIDVMEFRGQRPDESTGAVHGPGYEGGQALGGVSTAVADLSLDFHVFSVEWDARGIVWAVDDVVFHRVFPASLPPGAPWVFDHPFFLILNLAVGGSYVGPPDATTVFPQALRVDYVRVYERVE
ncbi:MAG: glycoside hydrolase family 16 protein [bacterium]